MELKREENIFYLGNNSKTADAFIKVENVSEGVIDIVKTFVDPKLRGQGVALKLMNFVLEYARENNLKIVPSCSYAEKYFEKNEKDRDLLK